MLPLEGLRSNVVGWWASHPAEAIDGVVVTNSFKSVKYNPVRGWTYPPGTFHPEHMAEDLAKFRILPTELTEEHLLPFIPDEAQIDQTRDQRLGQFAGTLAETGSIQAVATALMELEDWDLTAIYFDCIDHLCHGFMRYYPPRHPDIMEADLQMYKDVIAGANRFHDMMLERRLQLAGPDTTAILCSDHGFESGHLRKMGFPREPAGPANDHGDMGIIVIILGTDHDYEGIWVHIVALIALSLARLILNNKTSVGKDAHHAETRSSRYPEYRLAHYSTR